MTGEEQMDELPSLHDQNNQKFSKSNNYGATDVDLLNFPICLNKMISGSKLLQ